MQEDYRRPVLRVSAACPLCKAPLLMRTRRNDGNPFVGCSSFPACRFVEPYDTLHGALLDEIDDLRHELHEARKGNPSAPSPVGERIKALLFEWHPDRHPEAIPSGRVAAELNQLRRLVGVRCRAPRSEAR